MPSRWVGAGEQQAEAALLERQAGSTTSTGELDDRLASATASGPLPAMRPARRRISGISSSWATTLSARPTRSASAASIMSPVMHSSLALACRAGAACAGCRRTRG